MLVHYYNTIIECGVGPPGHYRDVVDGINDTETWFISTLMKNVQFTGSKGYNNQMAMHAPTNKGEVSLSKELKTCVQYNKKEWLH